MPRTGRRGNGAGDAAFRAGAAPADSWRGSRSRRRNSRGEPISVRLARGENPVRWWMRSNAREWSLRIAELSRRRAMRPSSICSSPSRSSTGSACGGNSATRALFDFLHREVGLSRGSAYYRQVASRLVGRFPEIAEPLRDGRLCISNVLAARQGDDRTRTGPRWSAKFFHCSQAGGGAGGGGDPPGGGGADGGRS